MKEKKKGWEKNKDLLVSSRWRRAAECPPGSQAPGRPWQTLWEREKDKESREFAMEWEIGRRMTARTRGGQGEVQWGQGRWIGGGLWWFCGCCWGVSAGWFRAAPATESCLWVCHWLCAIPKKKKTIIKLSLILPQCWSDKSESRVDYEWQGVFLYLHSLKPRRPCFWTCGAAQGKGGEKTLWKDKGDCRKVSEGWKWGHQSVLWLWRETRKQAASPF